MESERGGHAYLRAYMAGVTVPAVLLIAVMLVYVLARLVWELPVPLEDVLVFPMAVIPNAWGLWNMLYLTLHGSRRLPIGWYGAILPVLLMPVGWLLAGSIGVRIPPAMFAGAVLGVAAVYYLVWRYLVAALNDIVGIGRELSPRPV